MAERTPKYLQALGLDAVEDRLLVEDNWGLGQSGVTTSTSFRTTSGGGSTAMSVTVGEGRTVVYSDVVYGGSYHGVMDASKPLELAQASSTEYRRDAVVARIRDATLVASDGDSSFNVEVVQGAYTASSDPPLPSLPARSYLLYDALINPGATAPSKITDHRVMLRPRQFYHRLTFPKSSGENFVNEDVYEQIFAYNVPNVPSWVLGGGSRCYLRIDATMTAIAAGEVQLRGIIGNTYDDVKAFTPDFFYRAYSPGMIVYSVQGEFTMPQLNTPWTQMQARRVGTHETSLKAESNNSMQTHELFVVEQAY